MEYKPHLKFFYIEIYDIKDRLILRIQDNKNNDNTWDEKIKIIIKIDQK